MNTNLMQQVPSRSPLRKQHVALLLGMLALLSWAYSVAVDRSVNHRADVAGIPVAIAVEDAAASNLAMFLKIDGIAGSSLDTKHKGEIEADSYAWEIAKTSGKAAGQLFRVTAPSGTASPKLVVYAGGGVKLSRAVLSVKSKSSGKDMLKWILTDVAIATYKTVGNTHGDGLTDEITFSVGKVEVESIPADGGTNSKGGWDFRTGKSVQ